MSASSQLLFAWLLTHRPITSELDGLYLPPPSKWACILYQPSVIGALSPFTLKFPSESVRVWFIGGRLPGSGPTLNVIFLEWSGLPLKSINLPDKP